MYLFQVRESDIWNDLGGHELMQSVGPDNATYMYTKRRVMEAIVKLLETRTNSHGYAYYPQFKVSAFGSI